MIISPFLYYERRNETRILTRSIWKKIYMYEAMSFFLFFCLEFVVQFDQRYDGYLLLSVSASFSRNTMDFPCIFWRGEVFIFSLSYLAGKLQLVHYIQWIYIMGRSPNYGRNSNIFHITNGLNPCTGNDTPETNTWLNLQKIGCAVIWKGAGRFVT